MTGVQRWATKAQVKARGHPERTIARPEFPQPTYFGPRSPRWLVAELDEFDAKVAAGKIVLADRRDAVAQTAAARAKYMERVKSGEVRASRQATAARKRAEREADHA